MRYVSSNCLREGQVLAKDLAFDLKRPLLRRGVSLSPSQIQKITELGIQGVYINDNLSEDLEIANVISDELRHRAKQEVRTMLVGASVGFGKSTRFVKTIKLKSVISDIVSEIMTNRSTMVNMVDIRTYDDYTLSHSINVAVLSCVLGVVLNLNAIMLNELAMGALLHDIGKVFIDKKIINKPGKLTPDELKEARRHSALGHAYLVPSKDMPENSKLVVLCHHEQFNGCGYPHGLAGEDIHLYGRIACVADVYDALVSERPYRSPKRAFLPSDAVEYVMAGYNSMFDPEIVDAFTKRIAPYPIGTCVKLSNGEVGIVVLNYEFACMRPKIRLIRDNKPTGEYINLAQDHSTLNITIQDVVNI
ncbi:MAG: Cyclic di-GMP phosphodiesterase response regulator RpfG [Firmicutes bacterium ADurb.Bin356]|nr:MAG: Cyclic di-GMP phosphodiesterase response regulator RpfG [Firmicutes bacterium ADurb.Bin356]